MKSFNESESNNRQRGFVLLLVVAIILVDLVVGMGIYSYFNGQQVRLKANIISLQAQIDQLKQATSTTAVVPVKADDKLFEAKFQLALRDVWNIRQSFRNPNNPNQFYFITSDSDGAHIAMYDMTRDSRYQTSGEINIPAGNTFIFQQKLSAGKELRGIGFSDNKFVFIETNSDNSSGPCASPWLSSNLQYIDLGVATPVRKAFVLPAALKQAEIQKEAACTKAL